jgi:hypothetical protein
MVDKSYHIEYYATHRYAMRQQAFIKISYLRKDTERYYLKIAKQLAPLVKKEKAELKRAKALENKVIIELPPKKRKSKKVIKYKIIDNDDNCILRFD